MIRTALAAIAMTFATSAAFGAQCLPHADVIAALTGKYDESRRAIGLTGNGNVLEVWANAATGSWTITVTAPSGVTCIPAAGTGFEMVPPPKPGRDG